MEERRARVAKAAGSPADQAERAINRVFAFLKKQAPEPVAELQQELPEADAAAAAGAAEPPARGGRVIERRMGGARNSVKRSNRGLPVALARLRCNTRSSSTACPFCAAACFMS